MAIQIAFKSHIPRQSCASNSRAGTFETNKIGFCLAGFQTLKNHDSVWSNVFMHEVGRVYSHDPSSKGSRDVELDV